MNRAGSLKRLVGLPRVAWNYVRSAPVGVGGALKRTPLRKISPETAKRRRAWTAETRAGIERGDLCEFPGCGQIATEGHHVKKSRCRDDSLGNRKRLCQFHHRYVELNPLSARILGLSASTHEPIIPTATRAPSQRSGE